MAIDNGSDMMVKHARKAHASQCAGHTERHRRHPELEGSGLNVVLLRAVFAIDGTNTALPVAQSFTSMEHESTMYRRGL